MQNIDYNKKFNEIIEKIDKNSKPNLFLHSCCGPCSTSVLMRVLPYFNIFIIFYNPNIDTINEYEKRYEELVKFIKNNNYNLTIIYHNYNHNEYLTAINGYENEKEGGKRCEMCIRHRMQMSYDIAKKYIYNNNMENQINYFATTLTVSPHKNAKFINEIGPIICGELDNDNEDTNGIKINNYKLPCKINYLYSDFKKEDGYLLSIKLSKENNLYRQEYCGCEFAKAHLK